jgi:SAM-dependent methyltransferase
MHGVGSRNKLTPSHARLYPGSSTLDVLGRALCAVGCLPRKELHEAWEMGSLVTRHLRGGRVVDLCCGYGLLAQVMLMLDDTFTEAVAVDVKLPPNHKKVHEALARDFPAVRDRVRFVQAPLHEVTLASEDLVVSAHACGGLSDDVLARAAQVGARVAVLPCCHHSRRRTELVALADPTLAMDEERVERLRARGYGAALLSIPKDVSPKNRLVIGAPSSQAAWT